MKTELDCIPCFFSQVLKTMRMAGADEAAQQQAFLELAGMIPGMEMQKSPPWNSRQVYALINRLCKCDDPFYDIKKESNQLALDLYPGLKKIVDESENPLVTALKFSIAGNIIDYGALADFDVKKTLGESLNKPFGIWHFKKFYNALEHAENIIYLGDNAGEIVFDRLLIETIAKRVTFVVRGGPIINDVLMEDAKMVGITDLADVVSNSVAVPGTIVQEWPEELRKKFYNADLIISKGQGNFESLSETDGNIFFLFMIKCDMVARHGGQVFRTNEKLRVGDFILGSRQ